MRMRDIAILSFVLAPTITTAAACEPSVSINVARACHSSVGGYDSYAIISNNCSCRMYVTVQDSGNPRLSAGTSIRPGETRSVTFGVCQPQPGSIEYTWKCD